MIGVYKITNLLNQKSYIGQSVDIKKRWTKHKNCFLDENNSQYNSKLYRAIRKYEIENFSFEILEKCEVSSLNEREIFWIEYYNSFNFGYNLTRGGNSRTGQKLTEEDVEEISILLLKGLRQEKIAQIFNVSSETITSINTGRTWKRDINYPIRNYIGGHYNENGVLKERRSYNCLDCGKEITKGAIRCLSCYRISSRTVERPTPETLREELESTSFVAVGKKYGVSDSTVRKWCKAYEMSTYSGDYKTLK